MRRRFASQKPALYFFLVCGLQDMNNAPLFCFAKPGIGEPGSNPALAPLVQRNKKSPFGSFSVSLWLGLQDSNLRMTGPKPVALPLGEGPTCLKF